MVRVPYNGMEYEIVRASLGINTFQWYVYDSAGFLDGQGYVTTGYNAAVNAAKDYIDVRSGAVPGDIGDIEYDDLPPLDSDRPPIVPPPVEPPPADGVTYPHMMYDCETGKGYMAQNFQMHHGMLAAGYVHDLSECKIPPPANGGGNNDFLEKAGSQVIGIASGTLRAVIPITAMAVAFGFMRRIVKFGTGVSS